MPTSRDWRPLPQANSLGAAAATAPLCFEDAGGALRPPPPYELVLASDVVYQTEAVQPFVATLRALCGPATLVLASQEHREPVPFPEAALREAGFAVERLPPAELDPDWCSPDIGVYRLRLLPDGSQA